MVFTTRSATLRALPLAFLLAIGAGCDRQPAARSRETSPLAPTAQGLRAPSAAWFTPAPQQAPGLHLAYAHEIDVQVGGGALAAHFTATRDRCLNTPALHCVLMNASVRAPASEAEAEPPEGADLRVRLPHDQVAGFANALTSPLPGETAGLVRVIRQATSAEDLGQPMADTAQRTTQLTDYLTSLKALGARLTISVSDLVKIAEQTAQAQSQIEAVQAEQRALSQRVDTEQLDIAFRPPPPVSPTIDPLQDTRQNAAAILERSAADVLAFSIAALPWLPIGLIGLLLLAFVRRIVFGRRPRVAVVVPERTASPSV